MQRRERDRAGDTDQQPLGQDELPEAGRLAGGGIAEPQRDRPADDGHDDAEAIGEPAHQDAAEAEADHRHRVRQRGGGARDAELRLDRRAGPRSPTTCPRRRWPRAAARHRAASTHRRTPARHARRPPLGSRCRLRAGTWMWRSVSGLSFRLYSSNSRPLGASLAHGLEKQRGWPRSHPRASASARYRDLTGGRTGGRAGSPGPR